MDDRQQTATATFFATERGTIASSGVSTNATPIKPKNKEPDLHSTAVDPGCAQASKSDLKQSTNNKTHHMSRSQVRETVDTLSDRELIWPTCERCAMHFDEGSHTIFSIPKRPVEHIL